MMARAPHGHGLVAGVEHQTAPGDVLIQRGTNHAWSNRTQENAVLAFVLVDAAPL
jgi:hypothetical protein